MKKTLALAAALLLLLSFCACAAPEPVASPEVTDAPPAPIVTPAPTDSFAAIKGAMPGAVRTAAPEEAKPAENPDKLSPVTIEPRVLVDQDGVRITLDAFSVEGSYGDPELTLTIENKLRKAVYMSIPCCAVNGAMLYASLYANVAAGKTSSETVSLRASDLFESGIGVIQTLELSFEVEDADSYETLFSAQPDTLRSSAPTFTQTFDSSGTHFYDAKALQGVFKGVERPGYSSFTLVKFYFENTSEQPFIVQAADTYVNGKEIDLSLSCDILPGHVAFTTAYLDNDDLDALGITSVEELTFRLHFVDRATWSTIFDSDPVTIEVG